MSDHSRRTPLPRAPTRADMQAIRPKQAGAGVRVRTAAAKLSELVAEAQARRDETTIERLIVKGLTPCYHGIDDMARRALAAAEPPLTGTVRDAVIAATVAHGCTTHGADVPAWTQAPERRPLRARIGAARMSGMAGG